MTKANWRECKLGDLLQVKHGFAFLGEHFSRVGTHVVLTPGNFFEAGGFKENSEKAKWYDGPIPSDYVLNEGDLIIAMTEQGEGLLGSSAIIPRSGVYLHNQRLGLVQIRDRSQTDQHFVYYLFNSKLVRQQIRGSASGAKIRHTAPSRIAEVKVTVPPLPVQQRIGGILSAYDELMRNNQRRIWILEEMARTLYREWFVHFRFPGHEKLPRGRSLLGNVPRGWEVSSVREVADLVSRGPSLTYVSQNGIPVLNQRCIRNGEIELQAIQYAAPLSKQKSALYLQLYDVLINSMGVGTLGRVSRNLSITEPMIIHNCITVVRAKPDDATAAYLYYRLNDCQTHFESLGVGATGQTSLRIEVIENVQLLLPPRNLLRQFSNAILPTWQQIGILKRRVETLRQTRDLLLPRLLSGQVSLERAE